MDGKQERADKFTPGPWRARFGPNKVAFVEGGNPLELVAECSCDRDRPEDVANADLIAAAPDMYAALDLIDELVRECLLGATKLADDDWRLARVTSAISVARAAIARAEGRP